MDKEKELVIVQEGEHEFTVKDISGVYPSDSVLAGQTIIAFVDSFDTMEQAQKAYPSATPTHKHLMPVNSTAHLPDEPDYPEDDGW